MTSESTKDLIGVRMIIDMEDPPPDGTEDGFYVFKKSTAGDNRVEHHRSTWGPLLVMDDDEVVPKAYRKSKVFVALYTLKNWRAAGRPDIERLMELGCCLSRSTEITAMKGVCLEDIDRFRKELLKSGLGSS